MSIRSNELERRAVAEFKCPVFGCGSNPSQPCVKLAGRGFVKTASGTPENAMHPHKERTALAREAERS
jgi:hypothetical protein